jgi:predicted MFS family arabinose efflux permease
VAGEPAAGHRAYDSQERQPQPRAGSSTTSRGVMRTSAQAAAERGSARATGASAHNRDIPGDNGVRVRGSRAWGQTSADKDRPAREKSASWHVLGQHRFLLYFAGSLVSNLGTWLQNTAQMLLAYQLTRSAFAVGLITCAQFSGFLVVGPWAGALADRLGSRRVLVAAQAWSACVAGTLAAMQFRGMLTERALAFGALAMGLAFAFSLPVQTAMAGRLVPEADTKAAMAMNSVSYNAGRTLAPVLCVVVLANIGAAWAFTLNAISFAVFAATIIAVHPSGSITSDRRAKDWLGLRIAIWQPRILLLLVMVATVTIADDPILVLGPALAHRIPGASAVLPAYFLAALGLGTVLGALVPTRPSTARRTAVPLLGLAVSVVVFASGLAAWLSLLAALAAGIAALLTGAASQALLLKTAGPRHATQVMALWAIAWAGSKPIASLADGWLASHFGVFRAGIALATPAITVALLELFLWTRVKNRLKDRARSHTSSHAPIESIT